MEIEIINGIEWIRKRYSNGQLKHEIPFVNGKTHGIFRHWHLNGQLWYEYPYVYGKTRGLFRCWNDNGQLAYVELWNNGKVVFEIKNPPQTPGIWKLK